MFLSFHQAVAEAEVERCLKSCLHVYVSFYEQDHTSRLNFIKQKRNNLKTGHEKHMEKEHSSEQRPRLLMTVYLNVAHMT